MAGGKLPHYFGVGDTHLSHHNHNVIQQIGNLINRLRPVGLPSHCRRFNITLAASVYGCAALTGPAVMLPGLFGATPFRARAFRRCGGFLLIPCLVISPF